MGVYGRTSSILFLVFVEYQATSRCPLLPYPLPHGGHGHAHSSLRRYCHCHLRQHKHKRLPRSCLGGWPASASAMASPPSCFCHSVMSPVLPTSRSQSRPTTGGDSPEFPLPPALTLERTLFRNTGHWWRRIFRPNDTSRDVVPTNSYTNQRKSGEFPKINDEYAWW
jgi:hypothetical protein